MMQSYVFLLLLIPAVTMVINPSLQPADLAKLYDVVLVGRVTSLDLNANRLEVAVEKVYQGSFAPTLITIDVAPTASAGFFSLSKGQMLVAFQGKKRKGYTNELLFYTGTWQKGAVADKAHPGAWTWDTVEDNNTMYGIFNGDPVRLGELVAEIAEGEDYFPSRPYCRFHQDQVLAKLSGPARGVALADLNGDGKLDAIVTSATGARVWLQRENLHFDDVTAALQLTDTPSSSIAVADIDGDGHPALLLDGVLWQRSDQFYEKNERVPAIPGLITATFEEFDGDGLPDVLAATTNGVRVYLNPGKAGAPFRDATTQFGLDLPACGSGQDGMVASGDWDGDGRTDLFYAVGPGLLLTRDAAGVFQPRSHTLDLGIKVASDGQRSGGAAFGPIWRSDAISLLIPRHAGYSLLAERTGTLEDLIGFGNETSEPSGRQLWTMAEDLNADGVVDLYTASGSEGSEDVYLLNRTAGSFMRPAKYTEVFPGPAYKTGSWGVAAGDIDGDGANDLLLGGSDGTVSILLNAALDDRKDLQKGAAVYLAKLGQAHIITLSISGSLGTVGATVIVTDDKGRVSTLRRLGTNSVAGSWSGGPLNVTLREPGNYTVTLKRSNGTTTTKALTVSAELPRHSTLTLE